MNLSSENVEKVFVECLFKDGEDTTNHIKAEGVMAKIGFNPERIKLHKKDISDMLKELPEQFQKDTGGGWSFLNACNTKSGIQWTGLHQTIDKLLCLGLASETAKILMPREMWAMFPGGMPYFVVL